MLDLNVLVKRKIFAPVGNQAMTVQPIARERLVMCKFVFLGSKHN
jgi:hypothetical protein